MRRALLLIAAVLCGCPNPNASGSVADPRLGVLVLETNARPFSRAPPLAALARNEGHVLQNRARVVFTRDGSIVVVIGLDAGRPLGTANDVEVSRVVVKKVSPAGVVSELPSPNLGSEAFLRQSQLQLAGDGVSPVIVDLHGPANPSGRYVALTVLDGSTWRTTSFLRSDRAPTDFTGTWNEVDDQLRVLRPGRIVVQHGNTLVRHDGAQWSPVTLPAGVKELRLGAADTDKVRAYWVTTDGAVESDVLRDDGTWVGTVARIRRGTAPTLAGAWGFAGDLDTFTVHVASGVELYVLRHEGGQFRQAGMRPLVPNEPEGKAYLVGTRHPKRSAFFSNGDLTASFEGVPTGSLGSLIGWAAGPQVTCTGDTTVSEGHPVAADGAKCVPRALDALDFRVSEDVGFVAELFEDTRQDATLRYYVKRLPLPNTTRDVTAEPAASTGFPGEVPDVEPGTQVRIAGHVLMPGALAQHGTVCVLRRAVSQLPVETVRAEVDGTVRFSPVAPDAFEVQCDHVGFSTAQLNVAATQTGDVALDLVFVAPRVQDGDFPAPGTGSYALDGGALLRLDGTAQTTTVLSSTVAPGDSVRLLGPDVVWREADGTVRASTGTVRFPAPRTLASFRRANNRTVVASGVPDGATQLSWTLLDGVTPLLAAPAVEVAQFGNSSGCSGHLVWTQVAPGDVRVQRGDCQTPMGLVTSTQSVAAAPPMRTVWFGPVVFGFVGDDCGAEGSFTKACPAHSVDVQQSPLVSTELSATALDVRAQVVQGFGARVLVLEKNGATATLKASGFGSGVASIVVQAGIPLPASWLAGETPVTVLTGQQRFLVRTDTEVYASLGTAGSWTRVAGNVKAVFAEGIVLQNDGTLLRVTSTGATTTLRAKGNEHVRVSDLGAVLTNATTMQCPDGNPCPVLQYVNVDDSVTEVAVGDFATDVIATPRRFGLPTPRDFAVDLRWPSRRGTVVP